MPYLSIQTNLPIAAEHQSALLQQASQTVATLLGKPERYVMVALTPSVPMVFASDTAPSAYLALKSIDLPEARTAELSAALCQLVEERLQIPSERVYIEFTDAPRRLWGWNKATF